MATRIEHGREDRRGAGPRKTDREVELFYAAEELPCPVGCGGASEILRVATRPDGGGELWMECTSCAQRKRYTVPRASSQEKKRAQASLAAGDSARCWRHADERLLEKRGRGLICPSCGVLYRE
jgi:hypothetical protein